MCVYIDIHTYMYIFTYLSICITHTSVYMYAYIHTRSYMDEFLTLQPLAAGSPEPLQNLMALSPKLKEGPRHQWLKPPQP